MMIKITQVALLLVLIPILSCGQTDEQPQRAGVAAITSYYQPHVGDTLTYKIFKNKDADIDVDSYRYWRIIQITAKQITVEASFSDTNDKFTINWIPEENFLDNFLRLRLKRITYMVGTFKFRAVSISSDEVESIYAVSGRRSTFPTLLSVKRKGKKLLRLVKIERASGH